MYTKLIALASMVASAAAISGDGTYFDGTVEVGACADKHPVVGAGKTGVAISGAIYDNDAHCGKTVYIHGPNGNTIQGVVVDLCAGCAAGDLDIWRAGFEQIADLAAGRVHIDWVWA